ncbi:MAG TPA: hypothetical protein VJL58_04110 [Pyrinomonadaceae bacterium]|nr:hypothetical protein [Pyrinomonadaceae bacterium]
MDCKEFSEISEAYLSDELLVETNIQVFRHLESCRKCRDYFAASRRIRQQMRSSVRDAPEFQIDPAFASRLTVELKGIAIGDSAWEKLFTPKVLIPFFAGVLIIAVFGLSSIYSPFNVGILLSDKPVIEGVAELLSDVVGHHRTCAIEKLKIWEQVSQQDPAKESIYKATIVEPLRKDVSDRIRLLHTDDCVFEGQPFVHVILKDGETVISVFFAKSDLLPGNTKPGTDSIMTERENGFQVAVFQRNAQTFFVVSDLPEAENLNFARTLQNAWKQA